MACAVCLFGHLEGIFSGHLKQAESSSLSMSVAGVPALLGGLDRAVPGFMPVGTDERQFSNASDNSDSKSLAPQAACLSCSL